VKPSVNLKVFGITLYCFFPSAPKFGVCAINEFEPAPNLLGNDYIMNILDELRN
jgi:hypothetical protein